MTSLWQQFGRQGQPSGRSGQITGVLAVLAARATRAVTLLCRRLDAEAHQEHAAGLALRWAAMTRRESRGREIPCQPRTVRASVQFITAITGGAQRLPWMRIRFPAGSRKAQSRIPYGWSVGSWTTSASRARTRSNVPSRSAVARTIQP